MAKFLKQSSVPGTLAEEATVSSSAGAGDAGKVPELNSEGKLDSSMLPAGVGDETVTVVTSEALSAGDFVSIFNDGGVAKVQKALAADATKLAVGYVLAAYGIGESAVVYTDQLNDMVAIGTFTVADLGKEVCLSASTGGAITLTPPSATGNVVQPLGKIVSVGASYVTIEFEAKPAILRA